MEFQRRPATRGGQAVKKYFAQLRPLERRLAVGVLVIVLLVLNFVYVWPHRSDWGNWERRLDDARRKLALYNITIAQTDTYQNQVKGLESEGAVIALEDQAINLMRTIQSQSQASGVRIISPSRAITHTNDAFFIEQVQNIVVAADDKGLVDFLYKLGSGASMTRVRDLELQADAPRQNLNANIQLVASYQKNPPAPAPLSGITTTNSTKPATKSVK